MVQKSHYDSMASPGALWRTSALYFSAKQRPDGNVDRNHFFFLLRLPISKGEMKYDSDITQKILG